MGKQFDGLPPNIIKALEQLRRDRPDLFESPEAWARKKAAVVRFRTVNKIMSDAIMAAAKECR